MSTPPFRELMSPFDVINRQDLESFLGDFGDDGYETILQILSQMNNILDLMGDALSRHETKTVTDEAYSLMENALTLGFTEVARLCLNIQAIYDAYICGQSITKAQTETEMESAVLKVAAAVAKAEGFLKEWYHV